MDGGVSGNLVSDHYLDIVTFMHSDGWPWILPIHCQNWLCMAKSCYTLPFNLQFIFFYIYYHIFLQKTKTHTHPCVSVCEEGDKGFLYVYLTLN